MVRVDDHGQHSSQFDSETLDFKAVYAAHSYRVFFLNFLQFQFLN